jgi:hypothetical protein
MKVAEMLVLRMNSAGTVSVHIFRHIHKLAIPDTDKVKEYQTVNRGKLHLATGIAVSADKTIIFNVFLSAIFNTGLLQETVLYQNFKHES